MNALVGGGDCVEQPAPRGRVVQLELDAVAGERDSLGRSVEPGLQRNRPWRDERPARPPPRELVCTQRFEAADRRLVRAAVDDRGHGKARVTQPRGDARKADGVEQLIHVQRVALVEHRAGINDDGGSPAVRRRARRVWQLCIGRRRTASTCGASR